jgi:signal transduction histidine kinase/CHASE2 domain-containing sensor protein
LYNGALPLILNLEFVNDMRRLQWFPFAPRMTQGLLPGILCAVLVSGASVLGWLRGLERSALDALFHVRGSRYPSPAIVIVVADDATVARFDRWPLPRRVYADVVHRLHQAGVKTIAFDLLFPTSSYFSAEDDAAFIRACREAKNVIQAAAYHVPSPYNPALPVNVPASKHLLPWRFRLTDRNARAHPADWMTSALPALQASAPAIGHVNVYPERDGTLRQIPHLVRYRDSVYPSLALAAAAHFLDLTPHDIVAANDTIHVAGRNVPLDPDGETWINWAGANDTFPTFSINQLIDGRVPPEQLKGRIVLIGTTAAGTFEHRATPFSPMQPATELQANAIDDILMNRPLYVATAPTQWLLLFLFAMLAGVLTAPRRALAGTLWILALCFSLSLVSLLALSLANFFLPVVAPLLAGALTYAAVTAGNYRREWEANWRTDAAIATLAHGGELMASGRDREQLISVIHQTAREALGASKVFLVLEPTGNDTLSEVARRVADGRQAVFWPSRNAPSSTQVLKTADASAQRDDRCARHEEQGQAPNDIPDALFKQLCDGVETAQARKRPGLRDGLRTVVAAPLPRSAGDFDAVDGGGDTTASPASVLVAVGRREGGAFTARDATLLQTLAEQAVLALNNLEYYERLRGRVELANRDLRGAYRILMEQSAKLTAAVESIDDALIISDENGRAIFVNAACERVLPDAALTLGEDVAATLHRSGLDDLAGLFDAAATQASRRDDSKLTCEVVIESNSGNDYATSRRILAAQLTPLIGRQPNRADDGDVERSSFESSLLGAMLVVADVTAQRELDKMKTDFVSYVAHELRTPLTTILGYASLLHGRNGRFPTEQQGEMAGAIMQHCSRLNRMITELLDISRVESGHALALRRERFDLAELCERVLANQRTVLDDPATFTLQLQCDRRPVIISADVDRLEQIVTNLISNAIKYSLDGGVVTITLKESDGNVILRVTDTGMGMTPEQQRQLFQKFYRTQEAQALGIKGTGLGLYLVKQLVEAHNGSIEVASQQGLGTTFTVCLPRS